MRAHGLLSRQMICRTNHHRPQLVHPFRHHQYSNSSLSLGAKKKKYCAVLVDAENTPYQSLKFVLDRLKEEGYNPEVRQAYGDWSKTNLEPYKDVEKSLSFTKIDSHACVSGKGTSDAAMIVGAMDILHKYPKKIGCFALVSTDSDSGFTPLVVRLEQAGKVKIGFGTQQTPKAVARKYDKFLFLGNDKSQKQAPKLTEQKQLIEFLYFVILKTSNAKGWAPLAAFDKSFDHRKYGYNTVSKYFEANADRFQMNSLRRFVRIRLSKDGLNDLGNLIVSCHDEDNWASVKDLEEKFNPRLYGYDDIKNLLDDFPELFVQATGSNKEPLVRNKVPEKYIQELKKAISGSTIFGHTMVGFLATNFQKVDWRRFGYEKLEDLLMDQSEHFVVTKVSEGNYLVKVRPGA